MCECAEFYATSSPVAANETEQRKAGRLVFLAQRSLKAPGWHLAA
jgi:hypothetical protein